MKFVVCVVHNGNAMLLDRTLDCLARQSVQTFEYRVIPWQSFKAPQRNRLAEDADYVLYLYGGSVLEGDAVACILDALQGTSPAWLYFDEQNFDAACNADPMGVWEKPDFTPFGFAANVFTGEGVVFSRQILEGMTPAYRGDNIAAALAELCILAAAQSEPLHLKQCLLTRHRRRALLPAEQQLLSRPLRNLLEPFAPGVLSVPKSKGAGLHLLPKAHTFQKVSVIFLSGTAPEAVDLGLGCEIETIVPDEALPYLQRCLQGARMATGDVACFLDPGCALPNGRDFDRLLRFAALPGVGFISPCLYFENQVLYCGAFSQSGSPFTFFKTQVDAGQILPDLLSVRTVSAPAWQFWLGQRESVLSLLEKAAEEPLSRELAIIELAYLAEALGKHNLYVGNVLVKCTERFPKDTRKEGFLRMLSRWQDKFLLDPYCPASLCSCMRAQVLKGVQLHLPGQMDAFDPAKKKLYVLTHELSLTGAPIVLTHAVRILKEAGWQVLVVSPTDGVLREHFLRDGIPVLIQGDMDNSQAWLACAADFDLVLVNTVVPFRQIQQLRDFPVPVLWWLHDARSGYEDYLRHVLPETVGENIHIYAVSHYAADAVRDFRPQYSTELLPYGLKDEAQRISAQAPYEIPGLDGRKLFVSVGTVIRRKGQDILAQAVRLLPQQIREQCLFLFIGRCIDKDIYESIQALAEDYPEAVRLVDSVPHERIFSIYRQAAAVICSSRDDPLPTFMSETMMVSGVCICSENTGTAGFIRHGENGFLYRNDDPAELAACIRAVVELPDPEGLKRASRQTFEENFSMDIFRKNLENCVANCLDHPEGGH